jgi:hypothetical protein
LQTYTIKENNRDGYKGIRNKESESEKERNGLFIIDGNNSLSG